MCTCHHNVIRTLFQYWHRLSIFTVHVFTQHTIHALIQLAIPHAVWAMAIVASACWVLLYICVAHAVHTHNPPQYVHTQWLTTNIPPLILHTSGCVECVGVNGCIAEDTPCQTWRVNQIYMALLIVYILSGFNMQVPVSILSSLALPCLYSGYVY